MESSHQLLLICIPVEAVTPATPHFLLLEDGVSMFELEDNSGVIQLES